MTEPNIAFVGAGNMAQAIIGGLVAGGYPPDRLTAADPQREQREALEKRHGVRTEEENPDAVEGSSVVVLAVKPQLLHKVCTNIAPAVQAAKPLVLSVAAGVGARAICDWLGDHIAVIRVMPNSPSLIGAGTAGLYANELVDEEQKAMAERLMTAVGSFVWLDSERLLDPVTALSGSGPAYFFLLMEIMESVGVEMGLPADAARKLTTETALGAAKMALQAEEDLVSLRRKVTSPGGTTEAAIDSLEAADFREIVRAALLAARDRGIELSETYGSD